MTDDPQPVSGAVFAREVGADPAKWAREFLIAFATVPLDEVRSNEARQAFVAGWFRDAMNAAARDAMGLAMSALRPDPEPEMRA